MTPRCRAKGPSLSLTSGRRQSAAEEAIERRDHGEALARLFFGGFRRFLLGGLGRGRDALAVLLLRHGDVDVLVTIVFHGSLLQFAPAREVLWGAAWRFFSAREWISPSTPESRILLANPLR